MRAPAVTLVCLLTTVACQDPETGASFWSTPQAPASPKVLVMGWDGIRPDVLAEVPTPNLDLLASEGTFSAEGQTAFPSYSGPCWSSALTGVWPEKHGVKSNDFSTNRYEEYPDFLTRIEIVNPSLKTFAAASWPPLVAADRGGPLISDAVERKVHSSGYEWGWPDADSLGVEAAIGELRNGNPDALFVYLGYPDEISHLIRGIGPQYRESIEIADRHLGRLLAAIKARPSFPTEDWLVLVVTDHGRDERGDHGGDSPEEMTIFYVTSGPSARIGVPDSPPSIVDVAVTALAHLGVEAAPEWKLDGKVVGLESR